MKIWYLREMKLHQLPSLLVLPLLVCGCITSKQYRQTKAELLGYQYTFNNQQQRIDSLQLALANSQSLLQNALANNSDNRLAELEDLLAQREAALYEINQSLEDALSGFSGRGLSVTKRDGRVYVSLDEKLLFESGKSELSNEGIKAVKSLSKVLESNPNINITVEGHTDNTGYIARPDAQIVDNWDLSCKRATEVIRFMTKGSSIDPQRIIASGRGEFLPLKAGKSAQARAVNRRTEIILTPNIDHIWNILNK